MTKVTVIDVNLDVKIEDIIEESVSEITARSQQKVDNALAVAEALKIVKEEKSQTKKRSEENLDNIMAAAHQSLKEAGDNGVPVDKIMEIVQPTITSASAFSLRMKAILRSDGNKYRLERKNKNKIPHYIFTPFN